MYAIYNEKSIFLLIIFLDIAVHIYIYISVYSYLMLYVHSLFSEFPRSIYRQVVGRLR